MDIPDNFGRVSADSLHEGDEVYVVPTEGADPLGPLECQTHPTDSPPGDALFAVGFPEGRSTPVVNFLCDDRLGREFYIARPEVDPPEPAKIDLNTDDPDWQTSTEEIAVRFTYHPPKPDQVAAYGAIRNTAREFALDLAAVVPECRELHLALERLEEAVFYANAGIARRS